MNFRKWFGLFMPIKSLSVAAQMDFQLLDNTSVQSQIKLEPAHHDKLLLWSLQTSYDETIDRIKSKNVCKKYSQCQEDIVASNVLDLGPADFLLSQLWYKEITDNIYYRSLTMEP